MYLSINIENNFTLNILAFFIIIMYVLNYLLPTALKIHKTGHTPFMHVITTFQQQRLETPPKLI